MTEHEILSVKTDVALIKRDITQITQVYKKVDDTLEHISEIAKTIAVQEKILENDTRRMSIIEENFTKFNEEQVGFRRELSRRLEEITIRADADREKRHKEMIEAFDKLSNQINTKLEVHDKRITAVEKWQWYAAGIIAVIVILVNKIPWTVLLGGP